MGEELMGNERVDRMEEACAQRKDSADIAFDDYDANGLPHYGKSNKPRNANAMNVKLSRSTSTSESLQPF